MWVVIVELHVLDYFGDSSTNKGIIRRCTLKKT